MNENKEVQQKELEEMTKELNLICKAVHATFKQEQKKLMSEWLKEDLK